MQVEIRSRGFALTDALREHVERRLSFALSRVNEHVRRVQVRLADVNGPRGGVDKLCRIQVSLNRRESVLVEDTAVDVYAAIDRAAARAGRSVMRRLGRRGVLLSMQENDRSTR